MTRENLISSNFSPEALYADFEEFLAGHFAMVRHYGLDYTWVHMLVRLSRDDLEKARKVFSWSVKRVCMNMLADDTFRPSCSEISPAGLEWANKAEATFGGNPVKSLAVIEGIFLLERLSLWANIECERRFGGLSLSKFRKRTSSNEAALGKSAWIDQFYQQARGRAIDETERFVRRRDCAIALAITALAGNTPASDEEIDEALSQDWPTHQSTKRRVEAHSASAVSGSLVRQGFVVEWVLGAYQKEIAF
jgi:hypothetical protein